MKIQTFASGSKANCYLISDGKTRLMLECGMSIREIKKAIGFTLSSVAGCLVSHEHQDHAKALPDMIKAGVDCYASQGTIEALGVDYHHRLHPVQAKQVFTVGTFTILPFEVQHDAKEPLGFLIQSGSDKLVFITDSYYVKYRFQGLTHIMLECNYCRDLLSDNIRDGLVPKSLRNRIVESHFEIENVKDFLAANDLSSVQEIHLIHISGQNGDPDRFQKEVQEQTGLPVYLPPQYEMKADLFTKDK